MKLIIFLKTVEMFAKYQMNMALVSGSTGTTINIPITSDFDVADQSDIIKRDFVDYEVNKAVGIGLDNDRVRFAPVALSVSSQANSETWGTQLIPIKMVKYNVLFTATTNIDLTASYSLFNAITTRQETKFVSDDLKYNRNNLKYTFLRLLFYDEPYATNAYPITSLELFVNIQDKTLNLGIQPVMFTATNPIKNPVGFSEGYYLYHYKDDVQIGEIPKALYMKAEFNNAKDGKTTKLVSKLGAEEGNQIPVKTLMGDIYTKYLLKREPTGYYYTPDPTASNVVLDQLEITVKLYEANIK